MTGSDAAATRWPPLGWAAFLGASWTWVIGMYLPILMIRDLGLAGYLVFAVPNVIGAAAMGWVLGSPEASRRLVDRHRNACVAFSVVTIGYHLYWVTWLGGWAIGQWSVGAPALIAAAVLGAGVVAGARTVKRGGPARVCALAAMLASLSAMLGFLFADPPAGPPVADRIRDVGFTADALWMLPVSTLGFALCPYLDLTFNRARQACRSPADSRLAFGLGFGVCFALMIVFTMLYAGPMIGFVDGSGGQGVVIPLTVAVALGAHVALQWVFTVSVHTHEVASAGVKSTPWGPAAVVLCVIAGAFVASIADQRWFDMAPGEVGYRVLLSFYGLIFPAYVWLNVIDTKRRAMRTATARSLTVTAATIVLASPFYFAGFMLREEHWLIVGFGIVMLAKAAAGPPAMTQDHAADPAPSG
ncbi:MAG: hypothetical protein AAFR96_12190 [Planctomycetota bacterium]